MVPVVNVTDAVVPLVLVVVLVTGVLEVVVVVVEMGVVSKGLL